jgi:uncharacterized protein (DUF302 family)
MKKLVIGLIIGLVVGFLICGVVVWKTMPQMMLTVKKSNYGFEETFSRIENSIIDHDWDIQRIYDMQECMESYGYENIQNILIFSLCKPENVAVILEDDKNKKVTAIMPCRMGIYEDSNGEVYVSRLNIALMSKMFGGVIEEVMSGVAKDEADILEGIIEK